MKEHLLMSRKELSRKSVVELVQSGKITLLEASERMGLSYRQTLRVYARFVAEGDAGLVHRSRGHPSNRGYSLSFRESVLARYRERYQVHGFGPTLAAEKLSEEDFPVDHETLRRWLLASGDWSKRRRRKVHRSYRERRAHFGELVQLDGSHHAWFGPDHGKACLMNMVDDATGRTLGWMSVQETTEAAMLLLRCWIERHGVPLALYTDRKTVYITDREPTLEEQLAGEEPLTAFGKACQKLGIRIIPAHSPQAKGRVERSNGVYQDRFVKELALCGITTIDEANELFATGFSDRLNERFAIAPAQETDFHRPVHKALNLDDVFCHEASRTVQNDWTISYEGRRYQILKGNTPLPRPREHILVRIHLDGRIQLIHRQRPLAFCRIERGQLAPEDAPKPEVAQAAIKRDRPKPPPPKKKWRPNCDHLAAKQGGLP